MRPVGFTFRTVLAGTLFATCLAPLARAEDTSTLSKLQLSGFLSVVGGRVIGSGALASDYAGPTQINGNDCPCYTADWSNAGVYTNSFSLRPESRVGIQANYAVNAQFKFVGQLVSRGSDAPPNLQWAYAAYAPDKQWELQIGRKRIPLYYYSDFQDIGVSYPWISPPPELYGWEATNYNGASLRFRTNLNDVSVNASAFAGKEHIGGSLYERLVLSSSTAVTWNNIVGADLEVTQGALTVRAVYLRAKVNLFNADLDDHAKLQAYGIAVNYDADSWFVLSELTQLKRTFIDGQYSVTAPAFTLGAGYRYGSWTPFLNFAKYTEQSSDLALYAPQSYSRSALTLRYDIDARSSVKGQIDRHRDLTNNFGGDVKVLRLAYERLF